MKVACAFGVGCCLTFGFGSLAHAQDPMASPLTPAFGRAGTFAVGAERIIGFTWTKTEVETDGPPEVDSEVTHTHFDLLAKGDVSDPYSAPRLGFDYFPIDGLSVGGFFGYASDHEEGEQTIATVKSDTPERRSHALFVGPRVGYAYMFNEYVGIWPRAGLTYYSGSTEEETAGAGGTTKQKTELSGLAFSAEAMLVLTPVPHAGFIIGPTLDFPLAGSGDYDAGATSYDIDKAHITTLGIQGGVLVWF